MGKRVSILYVTQETIRIETRFPILLVLSSIIQFIGRKLIKGGRRG